MCGLTGYLNLSGDPASQKLVRRMTDAISHRGPDGEGYWVEGQMALGHRRLAIIDLSDGGRQPMETPDGRFVMVYNGEMYNYLELRAELQSAGETFHSNSDSEVVLRAIARWGTAAFIRFNGIFALAVWDRHEHSLLLARDRCGVKPLYYAEADGTLLFGSEIKALLAHPAMRAKLDLPGLREYLTFQNFYSDRTLFAGVRLLGPGSHLTVRLGEGRVPEPVSFWRIGFEEAEDNRSEDEVAEELRHLFKQAVTRQLLADVEVGAYLSGGMDSGSIAAVAAANQPHMRTFTCGFDISSASGLEVYFDERRDAERMSALFRTEHYEMVLKAGDMERIMPRLVRHIEEPRIGQSYPNFWIAGLAGKFNRVVLAGTGGDELFAGYPWRYAAAFDPDPAKCRDNLFAYWQRVLPHAKAAEIFAPVWGEVSGHDPRAVFDRFFEAPARSAGPNAMLNAILTFEARTFLNGLLVVEDKVSMAHGLEVRVPFLDNDLVAFAQRLPLRHKIGGLDAFLAGAAGGGANGPVRRTEGKHILRKALTGIVPEDVATREKQGFSAPDASWFKGESIDYVRGKIGGKRSRIYEVISYDAVKPLLDEHFEGRENHRLTIWSLLSLEETFTQFNLV